MRQTPLGRYKTGQVIVLRTLLWPVWLHFTRESIKKIGLTGTETGGVQVPVNGYTDTLTEAVMLCDSILRSVFRADMYKFVDFCLIPWWICFASQTSLPNDIFYNATKLYFSVWTWLTINVNDFKIISEIALI